MKKSLYTVLAAAMLPVSGWAHSGHAHAPADSLGGILHALTTHPLMFGAVGLLLLAVILYRQQ